MILHFDEGIIEMITSLNVKLNFSLNVKHSFIGYHFEKWSNNFLLIAHKNSPCNCLKVFDDADPMSVYLYGKHHAEQKRTRSEV